MADRDPSGKTCTRHAKALGKEAWEEFKNLRESYKARGLLPKNAFLRAYRELKIEARWKDHRHRMALGRSLEAEGELTEAEAATLKVGTQAYMGEVQSIGDQEMTAAEQVKWAMKMAARVQSGEDPPTKFPNDGALFWYQSAVGNRRDFEKLVLRVDAPGADPDNMYLLDGQHHFSEIEKNLKMALEEVGERLEGLVEDYKKKHLLPIDNTGGSG